MSLSSRSNQYGKLFGEWNIRKEIAPGSNGTMVYQIVRKEGDWEEVCALKAMPIISEHGDYKSLPDRRKGEYDKALSERTAYAMNEVQNMAKVRGRTNIVDYFDYKVSKWDLGDEFGCDFLIRMELLHNLRSELDHGRIFSEAEVIQIGKDICSALVVCHGKDILHRDIKPENIFFNDDGDYKLGDFGIARILEKCPGSHASTGIGTAQYIAPEQDKGKYDMRVDIYSLGLVLYELTNQNRLPFAESSYVRPEDVEKRINAKTLIAPCDASPELAKVILKACAHEPSKRYRTAQEMLNALNQIHTTSSAKRRSSVEASSNEAVAPVPAGKSYATMPALPDSVRSNSNQNSTAQQVTAPKGVHKFFGKLFQKTNADDTVSSDSDRSNDATKAYSPDSVQTASSQNSVEQPSETFRECLQRATAGDASAQFWIGRCYEWGTLGVGKNVPLAIEWYQKAADKGNSLAMWCLGQCYYCGRGIRKNYSLAADWYQKAADKGYASAMCGLGNCYYRGRGIKKNYSLAIEWYQKAADEGIDNAMYSLGDIFYSGKGVPKDLMKAMDYYLQALKKGNVDAATQYQKILTHSNKSNQKLLAEKGHTINNISDKQSKKIEEEKKRKIVLRSGDVWLALCLGIMLTGTILWLLGLSWWICLGVVLGLSLISSIFYENSVGVSFDVKEWVDSILFCEISLPVVTALIIAAIEGIFWVWKWVFSFFI